MRDVDYFLFIVPMVSVALAAAVLVMRLPGTDGRLTWRGRVLIALGCLGVGLASFAPGAAIVQSI